MAFSRTCSAGQQRTGHTINDLANRRRHGNVNENIINNKNNDYCDMKPANDAVLKSFLIPHDVVPIARHSDTTDARVCFRVGYGSVTSIHGLGRDGSGPYFLLTYWVRSGRVQLCESAWMIKNVTLNVTVKFRPTVQLSELLVLLLMSSSAVYIVLIPEIKILTPSSLCCFVIFCTN